MNVISYESWRDFIFTHAGDNYSDNDLYFSEIVPMKCSVWVEYSIRLFQKPEEMLPYGLESVADGLWYVLTEFDYLSEPFRQAENEIALKLANSMWNLFLNFFQRLCLERQIKLPASGEHKLESPCFFWWEDLCYRGAPLNPMAKDIDRLVLKIMSDCCYLGNICCKKSGVYGLGGWHRNYPNEVEGAIDQFLLDHQLLIAKHPNLAALARNARDGLQIPLG